MDKYDAGLAGASERTPLIPREPRDARHAHRWRHRPNALSVASIASMPAVHVPKVHDSNTIVDLICAIILVAASATGFATIPLTRLVENAVCHRFYNQMQSFDDPIDEKQCKADSIQSHVAFIFASVSICEAVMGFLAALPWGIVADRIGRRPVFSMALIGLALGVLWDMVVLWFHDVFPPKLIALSSLFISVGGGNAVMVGMLLSMVSDVVPEDKRATAFMRIHVASLVGNLVSPGLSSAMVAETGPWPVLCLSICFYLIAAAAFMFVPETLKHTNDDEASGDEDESGSFQAHLAHAVTRLKDSFSILKSPSLILLLLTCLVTTPFGASILQFMVQFVSKRYDISIESTGYVQSAYGIAQIVQALVFFPFISRLLLQYSTPKLFRMDNEQERDLFLAKWSFGLCFVGYMALALAPTLWMFVNGLAILALGSCFSSLTRSLMSVYVDPEHRSRLFSVVGMVELIGNMYGPPMLAGLFSLGMELGGGWIGLPYFGIACLSFLVILILLFVRVPKQKEAVPRSPI